MPKRVSLPSMLPPDCRAGAWSTPSSASRIAACSDAAGIQRRRTARHRREHRPALPLVADHAAEREYQRRGDQEDRQHLQEVRERRRVLERMRGVGVEEAAAIGAEFLDRFLRSDRPHRDRLRGRRHVSHARRRRAHPSARCRRHPSSAPDTASPPACARPCSASKFWITPWLARNNASTNDSGSRIHSVVRVRSTQALPRPFALLRAKPADQRDRHHDAGGGRKEVLHRQPGHLGEIAHRRFAGVALPVGIGDERHRGVERRIRRDRAHVRGLTRQPRLQALQRIHHDTPIRLNSTIASA